MTFRPVGDRIVLKREERQEKTPGGLYIPEIAQEKPLTAKVIALGDGVLLKDGTYRPFEVKVGDKVLVGKWSGIETEVEGENVVIVHESEISGVWE